MNKLFRNILAAVAILVAPVAFAQTSETVGPPGVAAYNFAYGNAAAGKFTAPQNLTVESGPAATGAGTLILKYGNIHTIDGITFMPLSIHAPITVGTGANAETVTPTAVSCGTPTVLDSCLVTATFSNLHGQGDQIASATFGIDEAVVFQAGNGGGAVWITSPILLAKATTSATRTYLHTILGCASVPLVTNIGDATAASFSLAATAACSAGTWTAYTATAISWY